MSSVQSKIPKLAKKQKNSIHVEIIQLTETDGSVTGFKIQSYVNKYKVLLKNLDLMVEETRESL